MGRLGKVMAKKGRDILEVGGWVKMKRELTQQGVLETAEEIRKQGKRVRHVVIGSSQNCLIRHGKKTERGFCPERTVQVGRDCDG